MSKLKIGSQVAYRAIFCRSIGQLAGSIPHARGVITALIPLGSNVLAVVDWSDDDIPKKVLVSNLCLVGPNIQFIHCD